MGGFGCHLILLTEQGRVFWWKVWQPCSRLTDIFPLVVSGINQEQSDMTNIFLVIRTSNLVDLIVS